MPLSVLFSPSALLIVKQKDSNRHRHSRWIGTAGRGKGEHLDREQDADHDKTIAGKMDAYCGGSGERQLPGTTGTGYKTPD